MIDFIEISSNLKIQECCKIRLKAKLYDEMLDGNVKRPNLINHVFINS